MQNTGPLPTGGGCSRAINDNHFLYFGGGIEWSVTTDGNNSFTNELWKFTYNKQQKSGYWTLLNPSGPTPAPRAFCSMDVIRDSEDKKFACVIGGATFTGLNIETIPEDYFYCYDIADNKWIDYSNKPGGPGPRAGALARSLDNNYYVTGGVRSDPVFFFEFLNDLYKFNIDTKTWTQLPGGAYYPRFDFRGEILESGQNDWRFVIIAGETLLPTFQLGYVNDTWEYDIFAQTWNFITDEEPVPNRQGSCIARSQNKRKFTIYGGDQDGFSPNCQVQGLKKNLTNTVWEYHVSTSNWAFRPITGNSIQPLALKRHECVGFDNDMLAFAGWNFVCPTTSTHQQTFFTQMYRIH
jgi:hypothetical protein